MDDRCLCIPKRSFEAHSPADVILFSTGYAKIVDLHSGGYALLRNGLTYQPANLPFNADHYVEIERTYKKAIQERVAFAYHDMNWLETDATLPRWDDYRLQIENGLNQSLARREG